jgi:hypothetical protein
VKIFKNIKEKAAVISLKKELKNQKRALAFNNFESATTVGFIFDAVDSRKYQQARDFMEFVEKQNNRIFAIGLAEKSDRIAYFPFKQGVDYFGLNEINWFGKPINPVIKDFLKRNFDILIDLSLSDLFPTQYIFASSIAKFKITNTSTKSKYADFIIDLKNTDKIDNYITHIKQYLKAIQAKQV